MWWPLSYLPRGRGTSDSIYIPMNQTIYAFCILEGRGLLHTAHKYYSTRNFIIIVTYRHITLPHTSGMRDGV